MPVYPYQDVIAWNNFEGMTSGATLTTANSGGASGTAFSGVQIVGGTIVATTTNPIHDTKSLALTSTGICNFRWDNALMGDQTRLCGVIHFRLTSFPTAYTPFWEAKEEDNGTLVARIKVSSSGLLRLTGGSADATVFSSTVPIDAGVDYRIEYDINCTTGAYQVRWALADSTTYIDTRTNVSTFGVHIGQVIFGRTLSPDLAIIFDTLAIATTPIGKRAVPTSSSKPYAIANPGGFSAVGGTELGVLRDASNATYLQSPDAPANAAYTVTMEPMNQTGKYSHTAVYSSDTASPVISCTVVIKNGATTLVTDTFNLTTTPTTRVTTTPADVAAGVELTVTTTVNQT